MFKLFRKKTKIEILQKKFEKLLEQSFDLSKVNRTESDIKFLKAQEVMDEIETYKE